MEQQNDAEPPKDITDFIPMSRSKAPKKVIPEAKSTWRCACGKVNLAHYQFCGHCGGKHDNAL